MFNRKFRQKLARVCFYSRNRNQFLRKSTLIKKTETKKEGNCQWVCLKHCIDLYFKIVHSDYWEYKKRMNNGIPDPLRKKSSQSEYHFNARYKHSSSFSNINSTTNYHLQYGRYSVCELNRKKSSFITNKRRKSTNFYLSKKQEIYQKIFIIGVILKETHWIQKIFFSKSY
jgi:hypothetical protein